MPGGLGDLDKISGSRTLIKAEIGIVGSFRYFYGSWYGVQVSLQLQYGGSAVLVRWWIIFSLVTVEHGGQAKGRRWTI